MTLEQLPIPIILAGYIVLGILARGMIHHLLGWTEPFRFITEQIVFRWIKHDIAKDLFSLFWIFFCFALWPFFTLIDFLRIVWHKVRRE